jgi:predicted DCC family thiol-disulfide oxidoreductase YuxK
MKFFKASEMTRDDFGLNAETVYFDGQCPLCTREIQFYRRQRGAENINWVDVAKVGLLGLPSGLTQKDALARFHIVNVNGQLISGGEAFSALWLSLPAFRWAGRFLQINFLASLLEAMYKIFLPCRPLLQRLLPKLPKQPDKDPQGCETDR